MNLFEVSSAYRQFYVADVGLDPDAPEDWTDDHVAQKFNALSHIVALCPEGDITARIFCCGPDEVYPVVPELSEFIVNTEIEIVSGEIGVFGFPRELVAKYSVPPGIYSIRFSGYSLNQIDFEKDYYGVDIKRK